MAIDPDTGDSILHAVVKAGNVTGLEAIQDILPSGRESGHIPARRAFYLILLHRNNDGDNALHCAVRLEKMEMVRALLRVFCSTHTGDGEETPGEYEWEPDMRGKMGSFEARRVLPVVTRNDMGRTPVDEAFTLGQLEIGKHLNKYLRVLDSQGERYKDGYEAYMEGLIMQADMFIPAA